MIPSLQISYIYFFAVLALLIILTISLILTLKREYPSLTQKNKEPDSKPIQLSHLLFKPSIHQFLQTLPLGVAIFDEHQNLIEINPEFTTLTGLTKNTIEQEIGKDLINFVKHCNINPEHFGLIKNFSTFCSQGEITNFKTQQKIPLKIYGNPVFSRNKKVLFYNLFIIPATISQQPEKDVSGQIDLQEYLQLKERVKEVEKAFKKSSIHHIKLQKALYENEQQRQKLQEAFDLINRQNEELERANAEIKEHTKMKERFLANTSHEIRTPLNAIIGFTNLLLKEDLKQHQLDYLKNIKASSDNLLVVLNDILDISKIEAGKMTFESIPFLIFDLVEILIKTIEIKAQEKEHDLICEIDPQIPPVLIGDPTRLNQILINLLSNAIKFTPTKGRVSLKVKLKEKNTSQVVIEFEVSDTGIGIAPEKIPQIFNAFSQAETSTTRKFGGTGLGLSIVKNLVELQNGEIFVESTPEQGSRFTFYLAFGIGQLSELLTQDRKEVTLHKHEAENISILLVEDNKINQQLALDTIRSWHKEIRIEVAENGHEALEKLKSEEYSMIFMDIQMPFLDGIETTRRIRQGEIKGKENIPIIAMTAHALKEEKEKCLAAGMNDYLTKPFIPEDLYLKIKNFGSQHVQIMVKSGSFVPVNLHSFGHVEQTPNLEVNKANLKNPFQHFSIVPLLSLYKGNQHQIDKILRMYYETIEKEISEMARAFNQNEMEKVQIKAHSLKPKMTYIGREDLHNTSKEIELSIKNNTIESEHLKKLISSISVEWQKIQSELQNYFNSK